MRNSNTCRDPRRSRYRTFLRLVAGAVLFSLKLAFAIDPHRAMSQYIHDRWGSEQGFPAGPVYSITQTDDGYLWIGTEAGLVRFDGWNFRLIQDRSSVFTLISVLGLMPDAFGNLWVRMQGPMILRYHDGIFENPMASLGYSNISAMCRTNQGSVLVLAMEHGALTYHKGKFEMTAQAAALPRSPVISMAQTSDGDVWLGTRDVGLFRLAKDKTSPVNIGLPDPKVNCLLAGEGQELWVGTDSGIVRWNGAELTSAGIPPALNHLQALAMTKDRDGNLWVGTDSRGLVRLNSQGVAFLEEGYDRTRDAVTAVFEDREGAIWIGGASGLERLRDSTFVTYSAAEGLPAGTNGPVHSDVHGREWFAPMDGGLYWLQNGKVGAISAGGLDRDVVYSIAGTEGDVWVGRQHGGLSHLHPDGSSFTVKTYTQADGLAQNSVFAVHESHNGDVWAGTLSGGASRLRNGKFTTYTTASGLASSTISAIVESSDSTMWFGTPNGLSAFENERWRVYRTANGLPSDYVTCLLQDSGGILWIGTGAGLAFLRSGKIQAPGTVPASLREPILGIAEDKNGALWIATSNRILRVKRDSLLRGTLREEDTREYGLADGLRGTDGVRRHRSVAADSVGRIWLSTNRGLSEVDPTRLAGSVVPAIPHIQTISADGTTIELRGAARLPAGSQRIILSFAGLNLSAPDRVRYRYKLDGFDFAWTEPTTKREAVYTNLNPGPYRFHLVASNTDGVWSNEEEIVTFEIAPLFWQALWFRLSVLLAAALAILAISRFRLHQLTRQLNLLFEERLAERTLIAQELHDTLLQGFLSASMQLSVAADQVPANSPAQAKLVRVLELMRQVIEEGRNAVRGLRSSQSGSLDLEHAFSQVQQELPPSDDVNYRVILEGQPRDLHPILRDEVYRIGREALVNAFRHSHAKNIEIELQYAPDYLRVLIRDNGCGIEPEVIQSGREGHWGLPGMRERAERIGAQLHLWSSAAAGTEVELSVPGHIAYLPRTSKRQLARFLRRQPAAAAKMSSTVSKTEREK